MSQPPPSVVTALVMPFPSKHRALNTMLNPPPAPLNGFSSLLPPYGTHVDRNAVMLQYRDAISSLSERLGTDKWFLGSTYVVIVCGDALLMRTFQRAYRSRCTSLRLLALHPSFEGQCHSYRSSSSRQPGRLGTPRAGPSKSCVPASIACIAGYVRTCTIVIVHRPLPMRMCSIHS